MENVIVRSSHYPNKSVRKVNWHVRNILGANTIDYGNKTDADIDALRTQGKYRIYAYQGTYWPVNTYGILYIEVANNYTIQYFIKMAEGVTYKRTMVTNAPTPTWTDWVMDYSTDILTRPTYLAPLASALKPYLDAM